MQQHYETRPPWFMYNYAPEVDLYSQVSDLAQNLSRFKILFSSMKGPGSQLTPEVNSYNEFGNLAQNLSRFKILLSSMTTMDQEFG